MSADCIIQSSRLFFATPSEIFHAFADPSRLARWWGPEGFSNTFSEFDFRAGGYWRFVMHGPNGTDYPNESQFKVVDDAATIVFDHLNQPHFEMTITLDPEISGTRMTWSMKFETTAIRDQMATFIGEKNEENFDRLTKELTNSPA